jgi:hypothetical protein
MADKGPDKRKSKRGGESLRRPAKRHHSHRRNPEIPLEKTLEPDDMRSPQRERGGDDMRSPQRERGGDDMRSPPSLYRTSTEIYSFLKDECTEMAVSSPD